MAWLENDQFEGRKSIRLDSWCVPELLDTGGDVESQNPASYCPDKDSLVGLSARSEVLHLSLAWGVSGWKQELRNSELGDFNVAVLCHGSPSLLHRRDNLAFVVKAGVSKQFPWASVALHILLFHLFSAMCHWKRWFLLAVLHHF